MHDIAAIRAAHPIAETIASAGVELKPSGRRLAGRCPFHRDRDPSFVVYPETASWFCYGCHAGGDVIDFVGRIRGTPFRETAALLSRGLPELPANVVRLPAPPPAARLDATSLAVVEATVTHYESALLKYRDVRSYLARRGISMETARRFRLGYAAGSLVRQLRTSRLSLDAAGRLGLLDNDREPFSGRVIVPDLDPGRRANWLTGRALDDREWDVPAVALVGTHASRLALAALRGFRTVYLALDADGPGRRASAQLASALGERAIPVTLPAGAHDFNELGQRRGGRDAFMAALAEARRRQEESWQQSERMRLNRAA